MDIEIIAVQKLPSTQLQRANQLDTVVHYRVDKGAVNSIRIARETTDKAEIEKHIKDDLLSRKTLIGHKFSL